METARVERLLAERSRHMDGTLGDPDFRRRVLGGLAHERARAANLRRAGFVLLASAAALLLALLWGRPGDVRREGLAVQVALLDAGGRELIPDGGVRGGGETLSWPEVVRVELLAEQDGFARVFLYDAEGRLREHTQGAYATLTAGAAVLFTFQLGAAWDGAGAEPELSWLIATAGQPFEAELLELPAQLGAASGPERERELEALVARSASASGCTLSLRHLE